MENVQMKAGGLQCDNPTCDWKDETISVESYGKWINQPCPKCGENVLTEEDYKNTQLLIATVAFLNTLTQEEVDDLNAAADVDAGLAALKEHPLFKQAKGLDELKPDGLVSIKVSTHREIKVLEVKNIETENKAHEKI